jgi:hypothetical protein
MSSGSRYHSCMNRLVLGLAVLGFSVGLQAQVFGPRASVTSLGDGFTLHNPPGVRASVTSLGPQGFTPRPFSPRGPAAIPRNRPFFREHHRQFNGGVSLPVYVIPYYYADYPMLVDPTDTSMEENYGPPGPTIFDRHGSGASSGELERQYDERLNRLEKQVDEAEENRVPQTTARVEAPEAPAADQPATVLVFHDGHTAEVRNYAIVGDALFDFSTGVRHKIALSELDLGATQKENENRGVDFHLPSSLRD